jgi:hypothetical protein
MYVLGFSLLCLYGILRAYLDFRQAINSEDIDQHLREINDSLYSIKVRMKNDKDDTMRK